MNKRKSKGEHLTDTTHSPVYNFLQLIRQHRHNAAIGVLKYLKPVDIWNLLVTSKAVKAWLLSKNEDEHSILRIVYNLYSTPEQRALVEWARKQFGTVNYWLVMLAAVPDHTEHPYVEMKLGENDLVINMSENNIIYINYDKYAPEFEERIMSARYMVQRPIEITDDGKSPYYTLRLHGSRQHARQFIYAFMRENREAYITLGGWSGTPIRHCIGCDAPDPQYVCCDVHTLYCGVQCADVEWVNGHYAECSRRTK